MDDVANVLKACIISYKGGVPKEELDDAYYKFTGHYIPYLRLGFSSLYEYLGSLKNVTAVRNADQELVYKVTEPKTAHIANLVEHQKDPYYGLRCEKTHSRPKNKVRPQGNRNWKRKALTEGRSSQKNLKKQKSESRKRLRDWNQVYDRSSSDGDEYRGDSPWDISDYEHWYEEEYNHPVKIMERPQKLDIVSEPIVNGKLLIGDDFLLQLAIRNIGATLWRKEPKTALHSGLCVSGQTIKECTRNLSKVQALVNKVVIMLGAEDIYRNRSSDQMIEDMENLLYCLEDRFALSKSAITLCTLPPLANLARDCHREQLMSLHAFNSWIREQANFSILNDDFSFGGHYNVIDFYAKNTNVQISTAYEYFQMDARMVSGSSHPYVLWSILGRRLAMNLIRCAP